MDSRPAWHARADAWFKLLAAIAVGFWLLAQAVGVLREFAEVAIILVGGILMAYFVYPAVAWLNRRLPLWSALTIVYVVLFAIVFVIFYTLAPTAVTQAQGLLADLPAMQKHVDAWVASPHNALVTRLPVSLQDYVHKLPAQITAELQKNAAAYTGQAFNAILALAGLGGVMIGIPVVSIYMLGESAMMKRFFLRAFPARFRQPMVAFLGDCDAVIGGFIRGQLIVAAVVGALATIALLLIGVPYAVVIGAWAGIADIIPYIGPFAGAIPAVIVALISNGPGTLVWVVVAFTAINQIEGHLLGPRIVSSTVRITPLAVIFALLIGAHLFGFFGLLVAVPLAGLVRVVLVHIFPEREVTNAELKPGLTHPPKTELDPAATEA